MLRLKSAQKMALARLASRLILGCRKTLGLPDRTIVKRGGVSWELDLTEGIDLSIYLLGAFEPRTVKQYPRWVKPGATVLDIGGNIGAHTLPLARLVGAQGRVIAFEPTAYAIGKMRANIALNPDLAERISALQVMLVSGHSGPLAPQVYSSWPLVATGHEVHREHGGQLMETTGAEAMTLDDVLRNAGLQAIDFIKMDVDGHEPEVLRGGKATLAACKPPILMELGPYLYAAGSRDFEDMLGLLEGCGYSMRDVDADKELPFDAAFLRALIPPGQTCNVLLRQRPT